MAFRAGRLRWGEDDPDAYVGEDGVEGAGELAVPVPEQEFDRVGVVGEIHEQVPGLLRHPVTGRVGGDAEQVHPSGGQFDDEQAVQPGEQQGFHGEEVGGSVHPQNTRDQGMAGPSSSVPHPLHSHWKLVVHLAAGCGAVTARGTPLPRRRVAARAGVLCVGVAGWSADLAAPVLVAVAGAR
jgi:hypothetical protein